MRHTTTRAAALWRRLRARVGDTDSGSSTLELVVLFPVVLLVILGIVQGAFYYYASHVAETSAREGLHAAQRRDGSAALGHGKAVDFVRRAGGGKVITGTQFHVNRGGQQVQVTVTGTSFSVIPGMSGFPVSRTVRGPVERYEVAP